MKIQGGADVRLPHLAPDLIPKNTAPEKAMFDGIHLDARVNSYAEFFTIARSDDVERLRTWAIEQILARSPAK